MMLNPYPGKLILLAGVDGSGKDTQARRLEKVFQLQYHEVKILRPFLKEPTKGPIGRRIYDVLFGRDEEYKLGVNMTDSELQRWFIKDRICNYRDVILPALALGVSVICNRGVDSTIVYGGNTIKEFKDMVALHVEMFKEDGVTFIWPDLIVIYDVTPETAIRRMENKKRDAFETDETKMRHVASNYRALAALYPNCKLVDAEPDGEEGQKEIFAEARKYIYPLLGIV